MQYLVSPTSTGYTTEAKGFNANGQLASMTWSGGSSPVTGSLQYSYSATQNNGQITQVVDTVSGETIVYQYDALKRLTSATSTPNTGSSTAAWTETFQYDGYGNLTAKVLNGTTTSIAVNAATNQLSSASYDYNGNMTSGVGATFTFDVANRMLSAAEVSGGVEYYGYAPDNKRIYKKLTSGAEEYTFYGGRGEKLGVYNLTSGTASALRTNVWFAGKLISENGSTVFEDRVGTNRASGARFYPFGDEITSTANDRQKFGTYTRDGYTGLDNAEQRFYASSLGRFNTPDPYAGSAKPSRPGSWNRYSYVGGDPVRRFDRHGRDEECDPDDGDCCDPDYGCDCDPCEPCIDQVLGLGSLMAANAACGPAPDPPGPAPCDPGFLPTNNLVPGPNGQIFTGADIDFAARAVYAESSGVVLEDDAIASVIVNRLNNPAFKDRRSHSVATNLTEVVSQTGQFNAVTPPGPSPKFINSQPGLYQSLNAADCANLATAITATFAVAQLGPIYGFTNFAATSSGFSGTQIGGSVFWGPIVLPVQ
jgi:RHS repeat-associated protein